MADYLPHEIVVDILSRLPVKSLVKFRCVSKSWNSLITSSTFITTHLTKSTTSHQFLVRHCTKDPTKEHYSLHSNDKPLNEYQQLDLPFKSQNMCFRVVGSCNGVVCLVDDFQIHTYTFILWNPLIRKSVTLPKPSVTFESCGPYMSVIGFGFDSRINDYKVVRLVYPYKNEETNCSLRPNFEVFSLNNGSWRSVTGSAPLHRYRILECRKMQAFVNGRAHWIAFRIRGDGSYHNLVASFDMGDEVFRKVMLPKSLDGLLPMELFISVCGESLAVMRFDIQNKCCAIWVMREYGVVDSWTRRFNVDTRDGLGLALGIWKNGDILVENNRGELFSFDYGWQKIKSVGIHGQRGWSNVCSYTESLVLLDKANGADSEHGTKKNTEERFFIAPRFPFE